jgi:hypothetical protein
MREWLHSEGKWTLNFKSTTDAQRGTSAARLIKVRYALTTINQPDLVQFLPDSIYVDKERKREFLPYYLQMFGGKGKNPHIERMIGTFRQLLQMFLRQKFKGDEIHRILSLQVSSAAALEGLHRRMKRVVKGKQKMHTKTPHRPSKRIEILTSAERKLLQEVEAAFDQYEALMVEKKYEKGIPLNHLNAYRVAASQLVKQQWELIQRISPVLAPRTRLLNKIIKQETNKKEMTKMNLSQSLGLLSEHLEDVNVRELLQLSPLSLIEKIKEIQGETVRTKLTFKLTQHGYKISSQALPAGVQDLVDDFARLLKIEQPKEIESVVLPSAMEEEDDNKSAVDT